MTFKKNNLWPTTFLLVIVSIICAFGVYHYTFSNWAKNQLLSWRLGRIQEKIPEHQSVIRHTTKDNFSEYVFSTSTTTSFSLHPSLVNIESANDNNLLTGNINIETEWMHTQTWACNMHITIDGDISWIIDNEEDVQISFFWEIHWRLLHGELYIQLDRIDITQPKRELTTLLLRDIVLHRFEKTRIQVPLETFERVSLIDPLFIEQYLESNISKIRLLSTPKTPWYTYALSWEAISITWNRIDTINNSMFISLPTSSTTIQVNSTETPWISTIKANQNNIFMPTFSWISTFVYDKKLAQHRIIWEIIYPWWVRAEITHDRFIRKASWLSIKKPPEKYIQREEVSKIRKEEKKQDVTLN